MSSSSSALLIDSKSTGTASRSPSPVPCITVALNIVTLKSLNPFCLYPTITVLRMVMLGWKKFFSGWMILFSSIAKSYQYTQIYIYMYSTNIFCTQLPVRFSITCPSSCYIFTVKYSTPTPLMVKFSLTWRSMGCSIWLTLDDSLTRHLQQLKLANDTETVGSAHFYPFKLFDVDTLW